MRYTFFRQQKGEKSVGNYRRCLGNVLRGKYFLDFCAPLGKTQGPQCCTAVLVFRLEIVPLGGSSAGCVPAGLADFASPLGDIGMLTTFRAWVTKSLGNDGLVIHI